MMSLIDFKIKIPLKNINILFEFCTTNQLKTKILYKTKNQNDNIILVFRVQMYVQFVQCW